MWKSWSLESIGDSREQRSCFSLQLVKFLDLLLPANSLLDPLAPPITTKEAVVRAKDLLNPIPGEKPKDTLRHIRALSKISRSYPVFSRAFLENGILAKTSSVFQTSEVWDSGLDAWVGPLLQLWWSLLGSKKDGKAQAAFYDALEPEAEFMDKLAFIAVMSQGENMGAILSSCFAARFITHVELQMK